MFTAVHYYDDVDPNGDSGIFASKWGNYGTRAAPIYALGGGNIRIANIPGPGGDSAYLTNIIAHEVGHSNALGDCYNCQLYSTIMLTPNTFLTGSNATPQPCDLQQIHQTAYPN
jgi:hypothetical protein